MPAIITDEARALFAKILLQRSFGLDRDANLELGLFINATLTAASVHADIMEPTGAGYARLPLLDGSWVIPSAIGSYAQQVFTAGIGGFSGKVQGYFIATISASGTKRLLLAQFKGEQTLAGGALTRSGSTATVVTPANHGLTTGNEANVRGADQAEYNGIFTVTVVSPTSFTYAVSGSPASPATGTIKINRAHTMGENDAYRITPIISVLAA